MGLYYIDSDDGPYDLINEAVSKFYDTQGRPPTQLVMSKETRKLIFDIPYQFKGRVLNMDIIIDNSCPFGMMYVTNQYDQWRKGNEYR